MCFVNGMTISSSSSKSSLSMKSLIESGLLVQPLPNLYILGTVHIGSKSATEVKYLINKVNPTDVIVEIPPSRLQKQKLLQQQQQQQQKQKKKTLLSPTTSKKQKPQQQSKPMKNRNNNLWQSLSILPDLAIEGFVNGGLSGMLFTTTIVGSSLIKLSFMNSKEEDEIPTRRKNEFEAAIEVAANNNKIEEEGGIVNIIAGDMEFDNLIQKVSNSMTLDAWIRLAILSIQQFFGFKAKDPIQRQDDNESMLDWELRRRNPQTARSSSLFSKVNTPELHQILVVDRDEEFANICLNVLLNDADDVDIAIDTVDDRKVVVCIVGLVHLDGIVDNIILLSS